MGTLHTDDEFYLLNCVSLVRCHKLYVVRLGVNKCICKVSLSLAWFVFVYSSSQKLSIFPNKCIAQNL